MANPHISYEVFKSRFGDLGITEWTKYNYLSGYNFGLPAQTVPSEYLELEYVDSGSGTYIDTGYKPCGGTSFRIKYKITTTDANYYYPCGVWDNVENAFLVTVGTDNIFVRCGGDANIINGNPLLNTDVSITAGLTQATINGNVYTQSNTATPNRLNHSFILFGRYNGSEVQVTTYTRIYYFQIYENGNLVRDMHPVRRLSDGAIGMYDTVSGQFFGNAGTGTFTAGPMKQRYVRVEYVQFNCNDAIQTGLVSRLANYIYDADIQFLSLITQFTGNSTGVYFGIGDGIFGQAANPVVMNPSLVADTQRHHFVSQIDTGSQYNYLYVDDVKSRSSRPGAYDPSDICIGAVNNSVAWPCYMKVYRYAIYENGILLRNFVPVYDLVTAKYGLFDLVSNTFYGSITGSLTGPWTVKKLGTQVWNKSTGYPGGFWSNQTNTYTWSRGNEAWIVDLTHKYHTAILGLGDVYGPDKTVGATVPELDYQEFRFMDKDLIDSPIGNALEYTWIFLK